MFARDDEDELLPVFGCWRSTRPTALALRQLEQPALFSQLAALGMRVYELMQSRVLDKNHVMHNQLSGYWSSLHGLHQSSDEIQPASRDHHAPESIEWSIKQNSQVAELAPRAEPKWRPYNSPCGRRAP